MDIQDKLSQEELKRLAAKGELTWKGKKVFLDPFTPIEFFYQIDQVENSYTVQTKIKVGNSIEDVASCEIFAQGVLQQNIFRFWKEDAPLSKNEKLSLLELKAFVDTDPPLLWKCPIPKWKPDPLPILVLNDRTGAFARLRMDYGMLGKAEMSNTPEELFWEKDLLTTDFIKKKVGNSDYYCPMDKVVKSLTFLLEMGWTILDHQQKKVVRQGVASWATAAQQDRILVKGKIEYGTHQADVKNVIGAFNRREKFLDLSPSEVGLLDCPPEWAPLADEEIVAEGIAVKRHHVGILEEIVPLPVEYQPANWEKIVPGKDFQGKLFEYQQQGLEWLSYLYRSRFSGLLADEMGLGKTVQVIAFLSTLQLTKPVLIVMPVSLLFHWKKELERFLPVIQDQIILTSYAQLRLQRFNFESIDYEMVILDEAQAIKNSETLTAQVAYRLRAPFKLAITGTPIENKFEDLQSLFRFLMPELLGNGCVIERVRKKIRPFTLRRTKAEVDLQLPEKQEQIVWVSWDEEQKIFYDEFFKTKRSALIQKVEKEGLSSQKMEILEMILRLRQICCHPRLVTGEYTGASAKFDTVCRDLEEVVSSGHKVILYSQFTSVLGLFRAWVEEQGWSYAYLDGQTQDRQGEVEKFQNDPSVQVFLMSLKAGGVGLNLQAADYVFLYDPWWNIAAESQAIDRAHRVGRQGKVIARKYLMAESIEEKILRLQQHKQKLAENLLEFEGEVTPIGLEELFALLTKG